MVRVRERWGGIRGHGQAQGAAGRLTGPWASTESGGEACGAMGKRRERRGGLRVHGQGQGAVGRHTGTWAGSGSGGEAYGDIGKRRERWGAIRGHGQAQESVCEAIGSAGAIISYLILIFGKKIFRTRN